MAESNVKQLTGRRQFVPGTTLGRSGFVPDKSDLLAMRIEHLDALLCMLTNGLGEEGERSFFDLNNSIQASVLHLASSLATEVHELHTEVCIDEFNAKFAK